MTRLQKNPHLIHKIKRWKDLKAALSLFDMWNSIFGNKIMSKTEFCRARFGIHTNRKLLIICGLYLQLEAIELYYCPFKRSKKYYYRNRDKRYMDIPYSYRQSWNMGKILAQHLSPHADCHKCAPCINKYMGEPDSLPSPLLPIKNLLVKLCKIT